MKITMPNGFIFEGTQAEYESFLAFAETQQAEETPKSSDTITFEGEQYRKVDRKAQAGDVVVFRKNTSNQLRGRKVRYDLLEMIAMIIPYISRSLVVLPKQ